MAKKLKVKKKVSVPKTFKKVCIVCTSYAPSLKEAQISVGNKLLSHGIKGDEKIACMDAGTARFKEFTGIHTFSASGIISVLDSK